MSVAETIEKEFAEQKANIKKPNLMIIGGTGVGKSSLTNRVFGTSLAEVGSGKPITRGLNKYENEKTPLIIYDTEGYELANGTADSSNFHKVVIPEIKKLQTQNLSEQIHFVWYCISIGNHRITEFDFQNIELLNKELNIKCAIVFTQCDNDPIDDDGNGKGATAFRKALSERNIKLPTFETCANDPELPLQLEDLINWSYDALDDDDLRQSFVGAQKYSIELKKKNAFKVVKTFSATTAAAAGINPLPLSDAALILPQQIAMAVSLSRSFGFDSLGDHFTTLLKTQVVSIIGKQLATSLTKFIPVLGQIINATVAGTITGALGLTLIQLYSKAYLTYLEDGTLPDWADLFANFNSLFEEGLKSWEIHKE